MSSETAEAPADRCSQPTAATLVQAGECCGVSRIVVNAYVDAGECGLGCGMVSESAYTIVPLSPDTLPAFDALVQRHNGIFGGCWCIWFHPDGPERGQGPR